MVRRAPMAAAWWYGSASGQRTGDDRGRHAPCSARMGAANDAMAVTGPAGRVRGVPGCGGCIDLPRGPV